MSDGPQGNVLRFSPEDASSLPYPNEGLYLVAVRFATCPGSDLAIRCVCTAGAPGADRHGVFADAWWAVTCTGLPDRFYQLRDGGTSLHELLKRYGFLDAGECVNHRECSLHYERERPGSCAPIPVSGALNGCRGVPQFFRNSGVCWFAALCGICLANEEFRRFLVSHFPGGLRKAAEGCLYQREAAKEFRERLWYDHAVGDDVEDDPLNDGKNGGSEFILLCAKMRIPVLVFEEEDGKMIPPPEKLRDQRGDPLTMADVDPAKAHALVLRFNDGDHSRKYPVHRRVVLRGNRYRLVGIFMGQRKCGHQVGMVCTGRDWRDWAVVDADAHKDGIGPMCVHFTDGMKQMWWEAWRKLVAITKYGPRHGKFCPLTPWNVANDKYDMYRKAHGGSLSCDLIYSNF